MSHEISSAASDKQDDDVDEQLLLEEEEEARNGVTSLRAFLNDGTLGTASARNRNRARSVSGLWMRTPRPSSTYPPSSNRGGGRSRHDSELTTSSIDDGDGGGGHQDDWGCTLVVAHSLWTPGDKLELINRSAGAGYHCDGREIGHPDPLQGERHHV